MPSARCSEPLAQDRPACLPAPFGPPVRPTRSFDQKLQFFQELGFDAVQFHDDDAVPDLDELSPSGIRQQAQAMRLWQVS